MIKRTSDFWLVVILVAFAVWALAGCTYNVTAGDLDLDVIVCDGLGLGEDH